MKNSILFTGMMMISMSALAGENPIAHALQDKAVQQLIAEKAQSRWRLLSAKDLLVETLFVTGGEIQNQTIQLTFASQPRPGGTPGPIVCEVSYAMDASGMPSGAPSISCE